VLLLVLLLLLLLLRSPFKDLGVHQPGFKLAKAKALLLLLLLLLHHPFLAQQTHLA
jgi:hypothetical protein